MSLSSNPGIAENAKPFLKWAGGKTQLISSIKAILPEELKTKHFTYVEPFIGSGAVFFWMLKEYPTISKAIINDVNTDLTGAYETIKKFPGALIKQLEKLQKDYRKKNNRDEQKDMFMKIRNEFNKRTSDTVKHTANLIFLNKTCFNGLYRVNSKNEFNVPMGRYVNPTICDEQNIWNVHEALQKVTILNGDYSKTISKVKGNAFYYFDPPYKPISATASFNSYANGGFGDTEQKRLKEFCDTLKEDKIKWVLSNSDVKNINPKDNFFDELYEGYTIQRVKAKRSINSKGAKRGEIKELLICNF
jgi:DNA adenine methylase